MRKTYYFIEQLEKERKKGAKTFNILISKWSRKITTGYKGMKSDIYGLALFSWIFNFSYHSQETAAKENTETELSTSCH